MQHTNLFSEIEISETEGLTSFQGDSLASHTVWPGSEQARMMTERSGRKCSELYGNFSPLGWWLKMFLDSSAWDSTRCYLTWKVQAMPAKRLLFRLVPSMPSTDGTESGLLPTPTANAPGYRKETKVVDKTGNTPEHFNQRLYDAKTGRLIQKGLEQTVFAMIPTSGDGKTGDMGRERKNKKVKNMNIDTLLGDLTDRQSGSPTICPIFYEKLMGYPEGWTEISE